MDELVLREIAQVISFFANIRKILVSVTFSVRNSGARNGCANFMGAWKNALFLQEKPMSIKFLLLGGGGILGLGAGSADFIFMGARIFLKIRARISHVLVWLAWVASNKNSHNHLTASRGKEFLLSIDHQDQRP